MKHCLKHTGRWAIAVATVVLLLTVVAEAQEPKLIAAFFVKDKVGLKWQKLDGVSEYIIYRKEAGGEYQKLAALDDDHHFDTDLKPGAVYTYRIAVVGANGNEVYSAEKSVTIPGEVQGDFEPPAWVGLRIEQDKIYLNWDPVPGAIAYNVMRSETAGSGYEVVGNAQSSKWADNAGLVKGKSYYYVLTAMNSEFEETGQSEERHIKFGMTLEEQQALEAEQNKIELETVALSKLFEITDAGSNGAMNQPADVFVNSQGDIYVTDALNARVNCFSSDGSYKFSFGERMDLNESSNPSPGTFQIPFTLFIDGQDRVYVSDIDQRDIQVFDASGKFIRRIAPDLGDGMKKLKATGISILGDGRMVLTDSDNHRVVITDADGKVLTAMGERGSEPGQFIFPDELVVTGDGLICVVDIINCRVQEFDLNGKFVRTFGEVGQSAGTFARPKAIALDEQGRLWIADAMSSMLQSFTVEGEVKSAIGTLDDEWQFVTPRGMFFKDGRLYVVNRVPHRVDVYKIG